jgi:hypothetical protein
MLGECPSPKPDCKYAERGCFSDTDHIVPRRLATTALSATYIELQANKQQLCRREHEEKTAQGDEPLPEIAEMREAIVLAHAMGEIALSRRKMKAVYGRDWRDYRERVQEMRQEGQNNGPIIFTTPALS